MLKRPIPSSLSYISGRACFGGLSIDFVFFLFGNMGLVVPAKSDGGDPRF